MDDNIIYSRSNNNNDSDSDEELVEAGKRLSLKSKSKKVKFEDEKDSDEDQEEPKGLQASLYEKVCTGKKLATHREIKKLLESIKPADKQVTCIFDKPTK